MWTTKAQMLNFQGAHRIKGSLVLEGSWWSWFDVKLSWLHWCGFSPVCFLSQSVISLHWKVALCTLMLLFNFLFEWFAALCTILKLLLVLVHSRSLHILLCQLHSWTFLVEQSCCCVLFCCGLKMTPCGWSLVHTEGRWIYSLYCHQRLHLQKCFLWYLKCQIHPHCCLLDFHPRYGQFQRLLGYFGWSLPWWTPLSSCNRGVCTWLRS